ADGDAAAAIPTTSPIKHVIVIIGENRTFDHVYATYVPKQGQGVANLLSRGIIRPDGSPGPDKNAAEQFSIAVIDPVSYFINTKTLKGAGKGAARPFPPPSGGGGAPAGSGAVGTAGPRPRQYCGAVRCDHILAGAAPADLARVEGHGSRPPDDRRDGLEELPSRSDSATLRLPGAGHPHYESRPAAKH